MLIQTLQSLFKRDLLKLRSEIEMYRDEQVIWSTEQQIPNSAGNLVLHLVGNLNTFIGAELGKSGYIRNRDLEFSLKDIPRAELIHKIDATIEVVQAALATLTDADLDKEYPIVVFADKMSVAYFLVHLVTHLSYHLGQVNYHRRLLDTIA